MTPRLKDGHFRKTKDGYWQVRYRKDGFNIQFTGKSKQDVADRFKKWAKEEQKKSKEGRAVTIKGKLFSDFAERFFLTVKKINVEDQTFKDLYRQYQRYLLPAVGSKQISRITPLDCQDLLLPIMEKGHGRTAETLFQLLGEIFRFAIGEKVIKDNPMEFVKIPKHERITGTALSKEERRRLLCESSGEKLIRIFVLMLYTGVRRGELKTMVFEDNFVRIVCGKKHKGQTVKYRRIPIADGLREWLPYSEEEIATLPDHLTHRFGALFPNHTLKDLRHTFTTVCLECGIQKALVDVWTGHVNKSDMTTSVYTHFSDRYMLEEIKKLIF